MRLCLRGSALVARSLTPSLANTLNEAAQLRPLDAATVQSGTQVILIQGVLKDGRINRENQQFRLLTADPRA